MGYFPAIQAMFFRDLGIVASSARRSTAKPCPLPRRRCWLVISLCLFNVAKMIEMEIIYLAGGFAT